MFRLTTHSIFDLLAHAQDLQWPIQKIYSFSIYEKTINQLKGAFWQPKMSPTNY